MSEERHATSGNLGGKVCQLDHEPSPLTPNVKASREVVRRIVSRPMRLVALLLAVQAAQAQEVPALLEFPEAGLDDPAVYRDYRTRFYRDANRNAVQVYLRRDAGRVVHLWANAANESAGFTVRDSAGRPAPLEWGPGGADTSRSSRGLTTTYRLDLGRRPVVLGWFLLGSMRVERDFQYGGGHLAPFHAPPFRVRELVDLITSLERLPPIERSRHLVALGASTMDELRNRLDPTVMLRRTETMWTARITQQSFDEKNRISLELRVATAAADVTVGARTVTIRPRGNAPVVLTVSATTDARSLTPLGRDVMFNFEFQAWAEAVRGAGDAVAGRRLERQIRGLELVTYREKLMAGLPNFATYFGRDMMVTSLLMEPIWSGAMLEHVLGTVLRKLSPGGEVSHEEALGGQAIREHAAEYSALIAEYFRLGAGPRADSLLARARVMLTGLQAVRENYHMVDDDFQLPVVAAHYLTNPRVQVERKRTFLTDTARSRTAAPALDLLFKNLRFVTGRAAAYVREPVDTNLVGFPPSGPGRWLSGSWRDSGPGYANGRFAMDVNVVWVPEALAATARILAALRELGLEDRIAAAGLPDWAADSAALSLAVETWRGARRHFVVRLAADEAARRIEAKLAWLPPAERDYWRAVWEGGGAPPDTLEFLALSLDAEGRPIPVMNSDGGMRLLLQDPTDAAAFQPFLSSYPAGLLVDSLGPLVGNDAYASRDVWELWRTDLYHSPRVVWGREVNILLMALARASGGGEAADALRRTQEAVHASGLEHAELWSYRIEVDRLVPERYGSSSDVQLWNLTDLAVEFVLSRRASAP